MQLRISRASKLKGSDCSSSGSHSWGHWSFHNHFRDKGRHEYRSRRLPWLYGHIQEIKGWQASWPSTLQSQITLDEGTSPPFGPIYSLSQEELAALCKSLMELATGSSVCLAPPWGSSSFHSEKRWLASTLCRLQGLNRISRKTGTHSAHFRRLLDAQEKHESTPKIDLRHATI